MEVICRVSGGPLGATQYRGYDALGQVEYNVLLYDVVGCDAGWLGEFRCWEEDHYAMTMDRQASGDFRAH